MTLRGGTATPRRTAAHRTATPGTAAHRTLAFAAALLFVATACSTEVPTPVPAATVIVAGETDVPSLTPTIEPAATTAPTLPSASAGPSPVVGVQPGSVGRSSMDVSATYSVKAAITVRTGALDVNTVIHATNVSGKDIDRLDLNTIAARLGEIRITEASVDDKPVKVTIADQTLGLPLGGVLPDGGATVVRIAYRATLTPDLSGSDWMFSRFGGTLALYRWIPWVSRAAPFTRPNIGDPFVTPTSPQVDVELLTDERMVLAGPAAEMVEVPAGTGSAWSFTVRDVRDVSVVLAPDFGVSDGEVGGVTIRVYTRNGSLAGERLLDLAVRALREESRQLGVAYPWPALAVVETQGGEGLEAPGLIWIPENLDTLNRTYLVHHEVAHQWFYGLVGNDQQAEPFADEAAADLLARTVLGTLRASRCGRETLDGSIRAYSNGCYYEVIYVQGGLFLDEIRQKMGTNLFWATLKGYVEANRLGLSGTRELLDALREASPIPLLPTLRARFPTLY
jgi:hypothetical protein